MTDGVKNFIGKQRALKIASQLCRNHAQYLHPVQHKDGVSEARRLALDLEAIEDDLEELNRLKRRQQPAGALR